MAKAENIVPLERIAARIYLIRGQSVMLDFDLADLYRVETRVLVQALKRKGCQLTNARALIAGAGGVGSAIAASLAAEGARAIALLDIHQDSARSLANRLAQFYPDLELTADINDPAGCDIVVNATPMGTHADDPMPLDVTRIAPGSWVGEVVTTPEMTPFLTAAQARGCRVQVGMDMLFEQIPLYLDYFGFLTTTPQHLRQLAGNGLPARG